MTTPQMDWLDDQRRKRAVSSDDIVRRMELMDVPPGSYDEETLYDAAAEIERLRAENAALYEANHQAMWDDTLIPIANALGVAINDEYGIPRRQFQMVDAIIKEARRG